MADKTPTQGETPLQSTDQVLYKELSNNIYALAQAAALMVGTNLVSSVNRLPVQTRAAITDDGEFWTTVTERENDVWSVYSESGLNADKYIALVDIDNIYFPHRKQGQSTNRIDITSIYYTLDVAINTKALLLYGVISRIDAVSADVWYFAAIPFLSGNQQEDRVVSLRAVPSQVKLDVNEGALRHGISNVRETNVLALNTGVTLDSPLGANTVTPAVGDLILKFEQTAGTTNFATFVFYHTQ